jgi:deoxycytidylate deaminase
MIPTNQIQLVLKDFHAFCIDKEGTIIGAGISENVPGVHPEIQCLMRLAKYEGGALGSTMICKLSPCLECAKLIHLSGVKVVWYQEQGHDLDGIKYLQDKDISVASCYNDQVEEQDSAHENF